MKVEIQQDNFTKVLRYSTYLLEQIDSAKSVAKKESHEKYLATVKLAEAQE